MADRLYLSLWFPSFNEQEMMHRLLSVLKQFPFSSVYSGIGAVTVHSISWNEPTLLEERFDYRAEPDQAVALASEFLHDDNGYEFDAQWDLWAPFDADELEELSDEDAIAGEWRVRPMPVRFTVLGTKFDESAYQEHGHIEIDFGLDTPFLYEDVDLTPSAEQRVRANVKKLVQFTAAVEKNCGISGRVLWSESDENLAQKLIQRLQRVQ